MSSQPQRINERQDEPDALALLYAADVAHGRAQVWEGVRWALVIATAILAIVASFKPGLGKPLSVAGVFATAVTAIGIPQLVRRKTATAAMLQEAFDVDLFGLPWNEQVGQPPLLELVHELSSKFSGDRDKKKDWYVDVTDLPIAYAVLLCQRENLVWDFRQRRSWGSWVGAATASWLLIGVAVALLGDWTVRDLFLRWLAPSMAVLTAGFQETQAHLRTAQEKEGLALEVESKLAAAPSGEPLPAVHGELLGFARCVQDKLAESRKQTARVPSRFYRRRRPAEETVAGASSAQLRSRLLS